MKMSTKITYTRTDNKRDLEYDIHTVDELLWQIWRPEELHEKRELLIN